MIEFFEDDADSEDSVPSNSSDDTSCGMCGENLAQDDSGAVILPNMESSDVNLFGLDQVAAEADTKGVALAEGTPEHTPTYTYCDYCDTGQGSCSCGSSYVDIIGTINVVVRVTSNVIESDLISARDFLINVLGDGADASNIFQPEASASVGPFTLNGATINLVTNSDTRYGKSYVDPSDSSYIYFLGTLSLSEHVGREDAECAEGGSILQEIFQPGAIISTGIIPSKTGEIVEIDFWRSGEELADPKAATTNEVAADDQYFEPPTSVLNIVFSSSGKDLLLDNASFLLDFAKKSLSRCLKDVELGSSEEFLMPGGLVGLRTVWTSATPAAQVPYWGGKLTFYGIGAVEARLVEVCEPN